MVFELRDEIWVDDGKEVGRRRPVDVGYFHNYDMVGLPEMFFSVLERVIIDGEATLYYILDNASRECTMRQ